MRHFARILFWARAGKKIRPKFGPFHALLTELSTEDSQSFGDFLRMDKEAIISFVLLIFVVYYR
jgi:hypothetical protein